MGKISIILAQSPNLQSIRFKSLYNFLLLPLSSAGLKNAPMQKKHNNNNQEKTTIFKVRELGLVSRMVVNFNARLT